ncbi:MAG: glycosyltransferase family 2 protein [Thiobacillus sp.]|nr:glycosyltransferase family 2 protein [Thiobacillus sp.]MDP2978888.1 glycosyltransferase family 2 protein [Thiobacillus sp.]
MTNTGQPIVYILVLNYCSLEDTLACVESIRHISYQNLKLLVIDNNSPDGSGKILGSKIPDHEFLQLPENTGYAGGNNTGFKKALDNSADYILVVNPDVRLLPDSIMRYVEILERDKEIGALNPIQLSADGQSIDESFSRSILPSSSPYRPDLFSGLNEVKSLFGASLMLPARTIKQVGGFDPLFFAYGEEEDLCRRIRRRGLKLVVTTEAPVIHKRTKENRVISDFVLFLRLKGAYLYNLKNPALGFRFALKHFARDFIHDVQGKRSNTYPFNRYPVKSRHVLRSGFWIIRNLLSIRQHRKLDQTSGPYV